MVSELNEFLNSAALPGFGDTEPFDGYENVDSHARLHFTCARRSVSSVLTPGGVQRHICFLLRTLWLPDAERCFKAPVSALPIVRAFVRARHGVAVLFQPATIGNVSNDVQSRTQKGISEVTGAGRSNPGRARAQRAEMCSRRGDGKVCATQRQANSLVTMI